MNLCTRGQSGTSCSFRTLAALVLTLVSTAQTHIARADHGGAPDSGSRNPAETLVLEARELSVASQEARMRYAVVAAADRLQHEAQTLNQCVRFGDGATRSDRFDRADFCTGELREVRMAFAEVERLLYDANYDHPRVYRQYLQTREALEQTERWLRHTSPGHGHPGHEHPGHPGYPVPPPAYPPSYPPAPAQFRAQGSLDGMNFDLWGTRLQIDQQCHGVAARTNAIWFRYVLVNGRTYQDPYGRFLHVNDACRYVAQGAY